MHFDLPWIQREYCVWFLSHGCPFLKQWGWPVGRYSMAIIAVKSNGSQVWKGNKLMFLLLCFTLQTYSMFLSDYLGIFTKKNMQPLNLWIQPFPSFHRDGDVLLWELNTGRQGPTQGVENSAFTSWPTDDKENRWLERKEPRDSPNFTSRRPIKTHKDFKVHLPPPWSPPTLENRGMSWKVQVI